MSTVGAIESSSDDASTAQHLIVPEATSMLKKIPACTDAGFFNFGAVDLARKLVGNFLWISRSGVVVRIIETEAYLKVDSKLFQKTFANVPAHMFAGLNPGDLVMLETTGSGICGSDGFVHVAAANGDLVLIRMVEAIEGHPTIIERRAGKSTPRKLKYLGPMSTGEVFEPDMGPVGTPERLYDKGSIQLFLNPAVTPKKCGTRVIPSFMRNLDGSAEWNDLYRFAAQFLSDGNEAVGYSKNGDLVPLPVELELDMSVSPVL